MKVEITDKERVELLKAFSICGTRAPELLDWEVVDGFLNKLEATSIRLTKIGGEQ